MITLRELLSLFFGEEMCYCSTIPKKDMSLEEANAKIKNINPKYPQLSIEERKKGYYVVDGDTKVFGPVSSIQACLDFIDPGSRNLNVS